LMANARKKKNYIHSLHSDSGATISHRDKHKVIYDHFLQHIGSYTPRECKLNLAALGWQPRPL
jgi:hypothetical protein